MIIWREDWGAVAWLAVSFIVVILGVGGCVYEIRERIRCEEAGGAYLQQRHGLGVCVDLKRVPT